MTETCYLEVESQKIKASLDELQGQVNQLLKEDGFSSDSLEKFLQIRHDLNDFAQFIESQLSPDDDKSELVLDHIQAELLVETLQRKVGTISKSKFLKILTNTQVMNDNHEDKQDIESQVETAIINLRNEIERFEKDRLEKLQSLQSSILDNFKFELRRIFNESIVVDHELASPAVFYSKFASNIYSSSLHEGHSRIDNFILRRFRSQGSGKFPCPQFGIYADIDSCKIVVAFRGPFSLSDVLIDNSFVNFIQVICGQKFGDGKLLFCIENHVEMISEEIISFLANLSSTRK